MFKDRMDAGHKLANALQRFKSAHPLILALPRGGVVVGAEIARRLACPLDVMLVKKLRAPDNPELALGALDEEGRACINNEMVRMTGADESYLESEIEERGHEIAQQRQRYRTVKPRIPPTGRTTILVDDGLATGATMLAAVQAVALAPLEAGLAGPKQLVVAVPVSPPEALRVIEATNEVDEVICLELPEWFSGVGQFYRDFTQVSDEEVMEILKEFA